MTRIKLPQVTQDSDVAGRNVSKDSFPLPFSSYLGSEIDGKDGGGLGRPAASAMVVVLVEVVVVVVVSPLLLFPADQIVIAQRNSAVVLEKDGSQRLMLFWGQKQQMTRSFKSHLKLFATL